MKKINICQSEHQEGSVIRLRSRKSECFFEDSRIGDSELRYVEVFSVLFVKKVDRVDKVYKVDKVGTQHAVSLDIF